MNKKDNCTNCFNKYIADKEVKDKETHYFFNLN